MRTYTEEYIFTCLVTCDKVISKNLYNAKKWKNTCSTYYNPFESAEDTYTAIADTWKKYRTIIRSLLSERYTLREIIQHTKRYDNSCKQGTLKPATQKAVKVLVTEIQQQGCSVA